MRDNPCPRRSLGSTHPTPTIHATPRGRKTGERDALRWQTLCRSPLAWARLLLGWSSPRWWSSEGYGGARVTLAESPTSYKAHRNSRPIWPTGMGSAVYLGSESKRLGSVGSLNRPAFDAHLASWEGAFHGEQVRPGDAGEGGPACARSP